MYETWERYKDLLRRCPQHGYLDWLQIQLFYNWLSSSTKSILDVTTEGSIFSKNAQEAYTILENLATTFYIWPCERSSTTIPKAVRLYEVDEINSLKAQMASLTNALSKLTARGQAQVSPPSIASFVAMASKIFI